MSAKKVVVVDDDVFMLQIADDIITTAGFNAVMALSSAEAQDHIFTEPVPEMILIDIEMPLQNGDETARILKDTDLGKNVPIVLISNKTEELMQSLCDSSGADGYIIKPLTPEKFANAVKLYCSC